MICVIYAFQSRQIPDLNDLSGLYRSCLFPGESRTICVIQPYDLKYLLRIIDSAFISWVRSCTEQILHNIHEATVVRDLYDLGDLDDLDRDLSDARNVFSHSNFK